MLGTGPCQRPCPKRDVPVAQPSAGAAHRPADPPSDQAAVGFDLGFAGAAHETGTAPLALQMGPTSDQAASLVIQGRQFDLQPAFAGPGALAEDFQDQPGAVDDLALPSLFQVALLNRRQCRIDNGDGNLFAVAEPLMTVSGNQRAQSSDGTGA